MPERCQAPPGPTVEALLGYVAPGVRLLIAGYRHRLATVSPARRELAAMSAVGRLADECLRLAALRAQEEAHQAAADSREHRLRVSLHDARNVVGGLSAQLSLALAVVEACGVEYDAAAARRAIAAGQAWSAAADATKGGS